MRGTLLTAAIAVSLLAGVTWAQYAWQKRQVTECAEAGGVLVKQGSMLDPVCLRAADIRRMT